MLKAVKVRIYPTEAQQAHLAQAFGCARWVWNQSLATTTATYQETGKGVTAMSMKKCTPLWKKEFEWLSECCSQCLQQSVLNLGVAFRNFFDGRAGYPTFKKRQEKQSIQYPANVKVLEKLSRKSGKCGLGVSSAARVSPEVASGETLHVQVEHLFKVKNKTTNNRRRAKLAVLLLKAT
jgi:putative transposase